MRPLRWDYQHVTAYLAYVRPRLTALRQTAGLFQQQQDPRAAEWQRDFRKALHNRINLKGSIPIVTHSRYRVPSEGFRGWRKLEENWQADAQRDAYDARQAARRVRVYQFRTAEVRAKLGHLLCDRSEY